VRLLTAPEETPPPARRGTMRFRRANVERLAPDHARRQGEITKLAFLLLGKDAAIAFLNTDHVELGGRPLDLATLSDEGRNSVEAEIGRLAYAPPGKPAMKALESAPGREPDA
jgi:uncharacterized protein (DUF2384 family)